MSQRFRFHGYLELLDDNENGCNPSPEQVKEFADILYEKFDREGNSTQVWWNWNSGRIDLVSSHADL